MSGSNRWSATLIGIALVLLSACGVGGASTTPPANAPGVTDNSILLGATVPLSGAASSYGTISSAINAYFQYVNDQGGVNGRKITYKFVDDAYSPAQTVPLTKQLVEEDKVFAMVNGLGTQPQTSVRQYLNDKKVPQLFVATGASTWGKDFKTYPQTIGFQPNYQSEGIIYGKQILANSPNAKIAILYQNDDYGQDYMAGLTQGLGSKADTLIIKKEPYEATAADVKSQVASLKGSGADTFFIVATPKFSIGALATASALGWKPTIYLNSVSATTPYLKAVIKATGKAESVEGVVSVNYVKDPTDPALATDPGVVKYKEIMTKYYPKGDVTDAFNIYGMAVAYTTVDVLKKAGKNLQRDAVINATNNLNETDNPFLLQGVVVKTTPSFHFPITQVQVIKWTGGRFVPQGAVLDTRSDLAKS